MHAHFVASAEAERKREASRAGTVGTDPFNPAAAPVALRERPTTASLAARHPQSGWPLI